MKAVLLSLLQQAGQHCARGRARASHDTTTKRGGTGSGRMSGVERGPHSQIWDRHFGQAAIGGSLGLGAGARGLIMRPRWFAEVCLTPTSNGAVRARAGKQERGGRQMTRSATPPWCSAPRPRLVGRLLSARRQRTTTRCGAEKVAKCNCKALFPMLNHRVWRTAQKAAAPRARLFAQGYLQHREWH